MEEFLNFKRDQGRTATQLTRSWCWTDYGWMSSIRHPVTDLTSPHRWEILHLFWRQWVSCLYYGVVLDAAQYPANAYLYICDDHNYNLEKLSGSVRSKVRRGLKRCDVRRITFEELAAHGLTAANNSQERHGKPPMKQSSLDHFCQVAARHPCVEAWGSWVEGNLASYVTFVRVGDIWEIISSSFDSEYSTHYPVAALYYIFLHNKLVEEKWRMVTMGFSGFDQSTFEGLDYFKQSMGYRKVPVHKCILFHPLLRPLTREPLLTVIRKVADLAKSRVLSGFCDLASSLRKA